MLLTLQAISEISPSPGIRKSFMFQVWADLSMQGKTLDYFYNQKELSGLETLGSNAQSSWWDRVRPLLRDNSIALPTFGRDKPKGNEWQRLKEPDIWSSNLEVAKEALTRISARMQKAHDTQVSKKRRAGDKRKYVWTGDSSAVKKQRKRGEQPIQLNDTGPSNHLARPSEVVASLLDNGTQAIDNPSNKNVAGPAVFDLTSDAPRSFEPIKWLADDGTAVYTPFPELKDSTSRNILWKTAELVTALSSFGLTETTCPELVVINKSEETDTSIASIAIANIANNRPVLARGPRLHGSWENGAAPEVLDQLLAEQNRDCDVLNFVKAEEQALHGHPSERSLQDMEYEAIVSPIEGNVRFYLPGKPSDDPDVRHGREKMKYQEFVHLLDDPNSIRCILDLPTTQVSDVRYRLIDHLNRAIDNTKSLGDAEQLRDLSWSLLHSGGSITYPHHDGDGKLTIVNAVTGAKIWTLYMPNTSLSEEKVRDAQTWLAGEKEKLPKAEFFKIINVFLLPGDTLFMPPGMLHEVYTPVPSVFQGASLWNFNSLHLTAASLRGDSSAADILTNVDHKFEVIFQNFVRLAAAIPIISDYEIRRSIIYNLYDIIVNREAYIFILEGNDAYPKEHEIEKLAKEKRGRKRVPLSTFSSLALDELLMKAKKAAAHELCSTPHLDLAMMTLEMIIRMDGKEVPTSEQDKQACSRSWWKQAQGESGWHLPGNIIDVDMKALLSLHSQYTT
ncbi:hypothetical protein AAF712_008523 [Marasmius tenuissimus]|uniref:JmjC domain-containing protein n=1 Tax=Marasmius tenuissimus TaxID=585030 RepID=A0ABR2ZUX3_9AGAR